jgi:membrane dipeptidase
MGVLSRIVDAAVNRTALPGPLPATGAALALHRRAPIVDLVIGTALFRDTFVEPSGRGHVDLPRLRAAGVNIVGLTVATRFPNLRGTLSGWHFRSLGLPAAQASSDLAIAEWLIGRIRRWCAESGGGLRLIETAADLAAALEPGGPVGVLIGVQGGHALEGDAANVARLGDLGVRMLAPAHVMDNALVGSGTGRRAGRLSDHGREVIAALEEAGVMVDLAHMSVAGIEETLPLLRRPFVLSHTGLADVAGGRSRWRRYSPATRNIPASLAGEVGAAGGLVGILLSTELLGGSTLDAFVRTVRLAVESAGGQNVALGSDMDGALRMLADAADLPALTGALLMPAVPSSLVEAIVGGNAVRLLRAVLPG